MKLSVKLCLAVLIAYFAAAIYGEVQYRVAQYRDVTPEYNVVDAVIDTSTPLMMKKVEC